MTLSLRLLQSFVVVAEELHFGRAAERLHMTQPPLSQQMRRLESTLGASLFTRTTRSVQLTPAGKVLLKQGRQLIVDSNVITQAVQRAAHGQTGTLTIGFNSSAAYKVLPKSIAAYRDRYPDVSIVLKDLHSVALIEELRQGRVDVALMRPSETALMDTDFKFSVVVREPMLLALPKNHALAECKTIPIKELATLPFVGYTRYEGRYFHELTLNLFTANGIRPNVVYESVLPTMLAIVEAGIGVALVPASASTNRTEGLVYKPVTAAGHFINAVMHSAQRKNDRNPAVAAFIEAVNNLGYALKPGK